MWEETALTSSDHADKQNAVINTTVEAIADLTQFDLPINYSDEHVKTILDTALYSLLEKMRNHLDTEVKSKKKWNKSNRRVSELLISLRKRKTVQVTQEDASAEIKKILTESDPECGKLFANLIIKTKDFQHWERLITFLKSDFTKDYNPLDAMQKALERFNKIDKKDSN